MNLYRLHRAMKHSESSSISKLIKKSLGDISILLWLKQEPESLLYSERVEISELSQKSKLVVSPEATPNDMVSVTR